MPECPGLRLGLVLLAFCNLLHFARRRRTLCRANLWRARARRYDAA